MFGVVRPCRHVLCGSLFKDWMAHLCGLCLTLRAEHGQAARLVTNYDGLLVSVLVEAQAPELSPRRKAGPCALRGMQTAEVVTARAQGARLAAAASLLLAAGKTRDHVADGDGPYARRLVAAAAGRAAGRWDAAGERTGAAVGFDPAVLRDAVARQPALESTPGLGLLDLTEPTETAVAAVFAHTAVLAGQGGQRRDPRRGGPVLRPPRAPHRRGRGPRGRRGGGCVQPAPRHRHRSRRGPPVRRRRAARPAARARRAGTGEAAARPGAPGPRDGPLGRARLRPREPGQARPAAAAPRLADPVLHRDARLRDLRRLPAGVERPPRRVLRRPVLVHPEVRPPRLLRLLRLLQLRRLLLRRLLRL
ncbi:DUF5685 family protein [Actinomadura madurae]|uniref:DUF5685 family protein n=1 Tax=Actinomadura madurae TaxID=1993 RepID=UPI0027E38F66|nr:DUF5685 family protein [Actinomadura madurae]